jgi:hypothetical protein
MTFPFSLEESVRQSSSVLRHDLPVSDCFPVFRLFTFGATSLFSVASSRTETLFDAHFPLLCV